MKIVIDRTSAADYLANPMSLEQCKTLVQEVRIRTFVHYAALAVFAVAAYFLFKSETMSAGASLATCLIPAWLLETWLFVRKPLVLNIGGESFKMPPWLTILQNDKAPSELMAEAGENEPKRDFLDKIIKQGRNVLSFEIELFNSIGRK